LPRGGVGRRLVVGVGVGEQDDVGQIRGEVSFGVGADVFGGAVVVGVQLDRDEQVDCAGHVTSPLSRVSMVNSGLPVAPAGQRNGVDFADPPGGGCG